MFETSLEYTALSIQGRSGGARQKWWWRNLLPGHPMDFGNHHHCEPTGGMEPQLVFIYPAGETVYNHMADPL